jgi:hypothetical protein
MIVCFVHISRIAEHECDADYFCITLNRFYVLK